jgi:hypothetical protein
MKIKGAEGLSVDQLRDEINRGARLVLYSYCISVIVLTIKRPSDVYLVKAGQGRIATGLGFTLLTVFLGWWGIPWGPIYSIECLYRNLRGGADVTDEVLNHLPAASFSTPVPAARS